MARDLPADVDRGSVEERFLSHLHPEPNSGCWLWDGALKNSGKGPHGLVRACGIFFGPHQLAWLLWRGPIASGLAVLHRCDVPVCANPDHLFLGTHAENMADMARKGRALRGERNPSAKLTDSQAEEIRRHYRAKTMRVGEMARVFGVNRATVRRIAIGQYRPHSFGGPVHV